MKNSNIEYRFYVKMDLTLIAKVQASNTEAAVLLIESMSACELLKHELIDINTIDFNSMD